MPLCVLYKAAWSPEVWIFTVFDKAEIKNSQNPYQGWLIMVLLIHKEGKILFNPPLNNMEFYIN